MSASRVLASVVVFLGISTLGVGHAATIFVPGQYANLQDAINNANPNDVIVVGPGTYPPITIDKPLSIAGAATGNPPLIRAGLPGETVHCSSFFCQDPTISLIGPGAGTVTLSYLNVGGGADGSVFGNAGNAIFGGGFDALTIAHCTIDAPAWYYPTGVGDGAAAISVTVPRIIISDSTVRGGQGTDDGSGAMFNYLPLGGEGVDAPGATVTVVDSVVRGADGLDTTFWDFSQLGCPTCAQVTGGEGATAIVANTVYRAASTIAGGAGADLDCFPSNTFVCTKPAGANIAASKVMSLPESASGGGPLFLGGLWALDWTATVPGNLLVFSAAPNADPLDLGGNGLLFMDSISIAGLPGGAGPNTLLGSVPIIASIVGIPVVMQVFDPGQGLSRPIFSTFLL